MVSGVSFNILGKDLEMKRAVAMAVAAAVWLVHANPICSSCGREASTEDAKVCGHCQTPFPKSEAKAPAAPEPAQPAMGNLELAGEGDAFQAVKAELDFARKLDAQSANRDGTGRRPNVAFFHYHNALAMASLAKITDQRMRDALSSSVHRSLSEVTHFSEKCPACKGARVFVQRPPDIGQGAGRLGAHDYLSKKVPCPLCGAKGVLPGYRNYANMTRFLAEGRREFDSMHQAAGDKKVGYAWVPAALAEGMNVRDRAAVASAYGAPCPKCGWTGLEACQACKGDGVVACKAVGCKNGFVEATKQNGLGGGSVGRSSGRSGQRQQQNENKEVRPCDNCSGTALVTCEACSGARLQPCRKCNGEGLAPVCTRCSGTGLMNCRKCSGSGRYRRPGLKSEEEDCPDCRGLGEVNCQGCNGLGRRAGGF